MDLHHSSWPEPVVPVQTVSDADPAAIPERYIKPPELRPSLPTGPPPIPTDIPVIDFAGLLEGPAFLPSTLSAVHTACREWGFFQVVNHGVPAEAMLRILSAWHGFFSLPIEEKLRYANSPKTYEGYGSRLGIEKGAILDWGDYFFLLLRPLAVKDPNKWPSLPKSCKDAIEDYTEEGMRLYQTLVRVLSVSLGLGPDVLGEKLGGEEFGATMRVNYYPKCPQPELTLGLSAHSDPGTITVLLADQVKALQVRHGGSWIPVDPIPGALIINLGDQIQVLSNGIYKSAEHRVLVNSAVPRLSVVLFFNPSGSVPIAPVPELVPPGTAPAYPPMAFNQYRMFLRTRGPQGKAQLESLNRSD